MMFFKSYIAKMKFNENKYDYVYYSLLKSILKNRVVKYKNRTLIIRYEQNPKITKKGIQSVVDSVLESIAKDKKHIIKSLPEVEEVTKDDLLVSIPDYSLGLYLTYSKEKKKDKPKKYILYRFEKIRSKIRLFIDLDNSTYFSRKTYKYI